MELGKEVLRSIQILIDRKLKDYKADRTYKSVINIPSVFISTPRKNYNYSMAVT